MDPFEFVIVGAGPAGEAAAYKARERGASVAIVDDRWFGGSCPFVGCLPSKALLYAAARHAANPGSFPWPRASAHRDWMIDLDPAADEPDDGSHVRGLVDAGATAVRGHARLAGRGRVEVRHEDAAHELVGRNVIVAVGSNSKTAPTSWPLRDPTWSNREATLARELPRSLVILGGGPTGCELAQVYAQFEVPTTIVQAGPRLMPTEHPRNAEAVEAGLRASGVSITVSASVPLRPWLEVDRAAATGSTSMTGRRSRAMRSCSLSGATSRSTISVSSTTALIPLAEPRSRVTAGFASPTACTWSAIPRPRLHTHQAHYQGEIAIRMALGDQVTPDYRALPRATYTDPEAASVGMSLDQATEAGLDAFEVVADYAKSARGESIEAKIGHVTLVVNRASRTLVGAAMACPDASAAIHECVVAIKARVTVDVLADTIDAFPSTSRIFNGLFAEALKNLEG